MLRYLLSLSAVFALTVAAHAQQFSVGNLTIAHPWTRPASSGRLGVAYLSIRNNGLADDVLVSARTPVAASVEFHRSSIDQGMARMRPAGELLIAPHGTLTAEPGGLHLMLVDLNTPLVAGASVPLVLRFKLAGEITVLLQVEQDGTQ